MESVNITCTDLDLIPRRGTEGSAGFDLKVSEDFCVDYGKTVKVGTGVCVEIPEGYVGLLVPRSSTYKHNLMLANTVGVIDSDYRGEIMLMISSVGKGTFIGRRGDRLFQLVIVPAPKFTLSVVKSLQTSTDRGTGGIGSTGA